MMSANQAVQKVMELSENYSIHLSKIQQQNAGKNNMKILKIDTGNIIEQTKMQLKKVSYQLARSI
jgi:hypothetical protein